MFRIEVAPAGDDPRIALRNDDHLDDAELDAIAARLARYDRSSSFGAWTTDTLRLIADHPGVLAADLAEMVGRERCRVQERRAQAQGARPHREPARRLSPRPSGPCVSGVPPTLDRPGTGCNGERMTLSYDEAIEQVTAPGQLYETEHIVLDGVPLTAFKNAPGSVRDLLGLARLRPEATHLVYKDERWRFGDVMAYADALSALLLNRLGVDRGDRVAIGMRNYPEWVIAFAGIQRHRRRVRVPQRVVDRRRARLRPHRLRTTGADRRRRTRRALRRDAAPGSASR